MTNLCLFINVLWPFSPFKPPFSVAKAALESQMSVRPLVSHKNPSPSQNRFYWTLCSSTIKPINHWAYQLSILSIIEPIDNPTYWHSSLLTFKPIDKQAYWQLSLSTIKTIDNQAYQQLSLLTIEPIDNRAYQQYWQSSLLTIEPINHQPSGLLLQVLSLSACLFWDT